MDNRVLEKLRTREFKEELALIKTIYTKLSVKDKDNLLNSLNSRHQTALLILLALERGAYTYGEVATIVQRSKNTVMQYIYVLSDLGYDVTLIDKKAFEPTGRKQLIKRIS